MIEIIVAMIGAVAVVTAAIVPVIIGLRRARRENREQHEGNKIAFHSEIGNLSGKIDVVHTDIRDMRKDFVRHLENHGREIIHVD